MAAADLVDAEELQRILGLDGNALYPTGDYQRTAAAAGEYLAEYLDTDLDTIDLDTPDVPAAVTEAALAIAVDLWQHRLAAGGTVQAADFTPAPYQLGRSLLRKVQGLCGPWLDTGSMIG